MAVVGWAEPMEFIVMRRNLCALGAALALVDVADARQSAPVHVLRIVSGPSGNVVNGDFVLNEVRTVFNRADDREVIVFFQWEGAPGAHRLVAQWRSPDSAITSNSAIDYVAKAPRFGAFWSLPLSATMALGTWSIEATVDGVPAGRFTFEVTDNRVPSSPVKPMLTPEALYERLNLVSVVLGRSSRTGRSLGAGAGFSPGGGVVYTAMSVLDNADEIRLLLANGTATPLTTVVAWNRAQQWAVLSGGAAGESIPIAAAGAAKIGSRCVSLDGASATGRVLSECTISGQDTRGGTVSLLATFPVGGSVAGAPVLNEFGELIGLVGGVGPVGAEGSAVYRVGESRSGTPIVPIGLIRVDSAAPHVHLSDLRARGATTSGVAGEEHVLTGGIGRVDVKGKLEAPEHHDEISMRERGFAVFVTWSPRERLRGQLHARLFDQDNRLVADSKPARGDLRKGQTATSAWTFPPVSPGTYRADVLLNGAPMWRGFFRVTQ